MGREGSVIAILRGLKVRVSVLDRFLCANHVDETFGIPPFYDVDPDKQSRLLRSKARDTRTRIFVPSIVDHGASNFAYVAYTWEMIYAQKEISLDQQLPENPPEGWDALKDEILSFSHDIDATWRESGHGKIGLFIVVSDDRTYVPSSILKRITVSTYFLFFFY